MRGTRPRTTLGRIALHAASAAALALVIGASVALAWTSSTSNPSNSVSTLTLGTPGSPSATPVPATGACTSVTVSWTTAANADRYRVEANASGSWVTLAASHATTSYSDTTGYTNRTIEYRVTPLLAGTSWEGTPATVEATCGIGDVDDAVASNTCNTGTVSWSAVAGANNYDVQRRVNGGGWTSLVTNTAATSYNDTGVTTAGALVEYQVRAGSGGTNGNWGNTASVSDFGFYVTAISFSNSGTANSVNAGDRVALTFSKASNGTTPSGTNATSIYVRVNTAGTRGVYFASGSAAVASTAIGQAVFGANITGTSQAFTGTTAWSGGDKVWTWTRAAGAAVAESAPTWGAFNVGTSAANPARVVCSDGTSRLLASTVTPTGWF